jgi:hypothetical protein
VALQEKHRRTMYESFVPMLGEETTDAMLAQFPRSESEEPVTKAFLTAELAAFRLDLHDTFATKAEMHQGFTRQIMWMTSSMVAFFVGQSALFIALFG